MRNLKYTIRLAVLAVAVLATIPTISFCNCPAHAPVTATADAPVCSHCCQSEGPSTDLPEENCPHCAQMHDAPDIAVLADGVDVPSPQTAPTADYPTFAFGGPSDSFDAIVIRNTGPPPLKTFIVFGVFLS
jgi:hypothetical protein